MGIHRVKGERRYALEVLTFLVDLFRRFFIAEGYSPARAEKASEKVGSEFVDAYGGQVLYLPKNTLAKTRELHRQVVTKFDGSNQQALAGEFGITSSTVYRILQKHREHTKAPRSVP